MAQNQSTYERGTDPVATAKYMKDVGFKPNLRHAETCPKRDIPPAMMTVHDPKVTFTRKCTCSQSPTAKSLQRLRAAGVLHGVPPVEAGGTLKDDPSNHASPAGDGSTVGERRAPASTPREHPMGPNQSVLDGKSIQQQFEAFHAANPHVYYTLVRLAREAVAANKKVGIGLLWERMRWEMLMTTSDPEYKLNNNYRSRYARLIELNEMDLRDLFQTRRLQTA